MLKKIIIVGGMLTASFFTQSAQIVLNFNQAQFQGAQGQQAQDAFSNAAAFWDSILTDDVTVNLDINFSQLGDGILGGASSRRVVQSYDSVINALLADGTSAADAFIAQNMPFACVNNGNGGCNNRFKESNAGSLQIDQDNSADNAFMSLTSANAKALGFNVAAGADGEITFNSDFNFDYDSSDGVANGTFDFVSVAIHEIGHTLGFVSGVDIVDQNPSLGLDPFAYISTLDLFRFSSNDGIMDMRAGVDSYFSIDGGFTELVRFSTGVASGDGRQASHFKDNIGAGIMDPTFAPGEIGVLSELDVLAFDAIGWDFASLQVPTNVNAPGTMGLMGVALLFFMRRRFSY